MFNFFVMAMQFTDANFEAEVLQSETPVLVDFWAPWCGPCQILGPTVEELATETTNAKIGKLNVDENPGIASKYGIMSIPSIKIFKSGSVVKEVVGVQSKEELIALLASVS
jgi:thioredoxin 1